MLFNCNKISRQGDLTIRPTSTSLLHRAPPMKMTTLICLSELACAGFVPLLQRGAVEHRALCGLAAAAGQYWGGVGGRRPPSDRTAAGSLPGSLHWGRAGFEGTHPPLQTEQNGLETLILDVEKRRYIINAHT